MVRKTLNPLTLQEFLDLRISNGTRMPSAVHTTPAAHVPSIVQGGIIRAFACNVFKHEKLCYLFVGRPAYKWTGKGEASWWQCPAVFVLDDLHGVPIKRVYPFDSGAFTMRRLPDYITIFDRDDYQIKYDEVGISKFIEAFFSTSERYLQGKSVSLQELVTAPGPSSMKIEALIQLYSDVKALNCDDRARIIELQTNSDISLSEVKLVGAVLPSTFRSDLRFESYFKAANAIVAYYNIFPIKIENYFGIIYNHVDDMVRRSR